jgi:hypothetical protein
MCRRAMRGRRNGWVVGLVAAVALGACGEGKRGGEGPWEFHVDGGGTGATAARPAAWLRAIGKEGPPGEPQTASAILSLDCRSDHSGATILTEQALRQGSVELELTLDTAEPRRLPAFAGTTPTGGQVVLTLPLDSVVALLSGHRQATIQYADGAGSSRTTAVFPIAGLEIHRERFLAACDRAGEAPPGRQPAPSP